MKNLSHVEKYLPPHPPALIMTAPLKNLKSKEICTEFPFLALNFFFWHCIS